MRSLLFSFGILRGYFMGFKCKQRKSKSKRKSVGCIGCKYYMKIRAVGDSSYRWRYTC